MRQWCRASRRAASLPKGHTKAGVSAASTRNDESGAAAGIICRPGVVLTSSPGHVGAARLGCGASKAITASAGASNAAEDGADTSLRQ